MHFAIDIQDTQELKELVLKYQSIEKSLNEVEKMQTALKSRVDSILAELDTNRVAESNLLKRLTEKYNREFTIEELNEIVKR